MIVDTSEKVPHYCSLSINIYLQLILLLLIPYSRQYITLVFLDLLIFDLTFFDSLFRQQLSYKYVESYQYFIIHGLYTPIISIETKCSLEGFSFFLALLESLVHCFFHCHHLWANALTWLVLNTDRYHVLAKSFPNLNAFSYNYKYNTL